MDLSEYNSAPHAHASKRRQDKPCLPVGRYRQARSPYDAQMPLPPPTTVSLAPSPVGGTRHTRLPCHRVRHTSASPVALAWVPAESIPGRTAREQPHETVRPISHRRRSAEVSVDPSRPSIVPPWLPRPKWGRLLCLQRLPPRLRYRIPAQWRRTVALSRPGHAGAPATAWPRHTRPCGMRSSGRIGNLDRNSGRRGTAHRPHLPPLRRSGRRLEAEAWSWPRLQSSYTRVGSVYVCAWVLHRQSQQMRLRCL